jgi:hypothetical protein
MTDSTVTSEWRYSNCVKEFRFNKGKDQKTVVFTGLMETDLHDFQ